MSCLILEARTEYPRRHLCFGAFFPAWMLCAVLFRLAMKLATGAGNTTVIAMLIGDGRLFRFLLTLAAFDLSEKKDQPSEIVG
jgi:hypothetical protein